MFTHQRARTKRLTSKCARIRQQWCNQIQDYDREIGWGLGGRRGPLRSDEKDLQTKRKILSWKEKQLKDLSHDVAPTQSQTQDVYCLAICWLRNSHWRLPAATILAINCTQKLQAIILIPKKVRRNLRVTWFLLSLSFRLFRLLYFLFFISFLALLPPVSSFSNFSYLLLQSLLPLVLFFFPSPLLFHFYCTVLSSINMWPAPCNCECNVCLKRNPINLSL